MHISVQDYTKAYCYRPDCPDVIAFIFPADQIFQYNLAVQPGANIYTLCFDSILNIHPFWFMLD